MLGSGVLQAGSCRLSVLPRQLILVLASITWIPIRTQTGVTRCGQHFYQSLRILVVRYAIPYNPAKVGFTLVTIFLNLPNHYGLYV